MRARPSVALLIESSNAYARGLLRGISAYVREHESWSVFLPEYERGHEPPRWFRRWKGHGVIARIENQRIAGAVMSLKVPVVDVSAARAVPGVPWVETDDAAVAEMGFTHLCERGFWQLGFCGDPRFNWSNWRSEHFAALARRDQRPFHHYESRSIRGKPLSWSRELQSLRRWVKTLPKPIGIMACYDFKAQQLLEACRSEGIAVPEEIAVLGVDNDELVCDLCEPRLSSITLNPFRTGYTAAQLLDRMMIDQPPDAEAHLIPPIGVETRQSSSIFAVEDKLVATALQFIRQHARDGITVEDVAHAAGMSRRAIDSRFVALLGRTPHAEIVRQRIDRVKQLLLETDLPLSVIADRAGFSYVEYMSVAFKRAVGTSPGEFRRNHAGSSPRST
ncbi:MAG TPA: DNA-binding transcriptional regulator [Planctomycetaceae bacterium]|nr:DNA-binding transcriptional regulator [Planctomycetaceae bacterium]